jgi:hypothetical protein
MPDSLTCPYCDSTELVFGEIIGRSPGVKFKSSAGFTGDLTGILMTTGLFNHSAPAFRCSVCGTVIIIPGLEDMSTADV